MMKVPGEAFFKKLQKAPPYFKKGGTEKLLSFSGMPALIF